MTRNIKKKEGRKKLKTVYIFTIAHAILWARVLNEDIVTAYENREKGAYHKDM